MEWGIESAKFSREPGRRALSMLHATQLLDTLGSESSTVQSGTGMRMAGTERLDVDTPNRGLVTDI